MMKAHTYRQSAFFFAMLFLALVVVGKGTL